MSSGRMAFGVAGLVVVCWCGLAFGQLPGRSVEVKDGPPAISTTATARLKVKPDTVRISFGVFTTQPNVKDARKENDRHAKQILDAVMALQLAEVKIATSNENMEALMFQDENQPVNQAAPPAVLGYRVTQTFVVTAQGEDVARLRQIARKVVDVAVENGANTAPATTAREDMDVMRFRAMRGAGGGHVSVGPRIEYFKEDTTDVRRQALTKASEEALARAKALAGGAPIKVREISDDLDGFAERYQTYYRANGIALENTLEEGADHYVITCKVRVVCTYGEAEKR